MKRQYFSQKHMGQDRWVHGQLGELRGGTFLDVGCGHWLSINNTLFFERYLGWSGVAIDNNQEFARSWQENRPASRFVCADATTINYADLLVGLPDVIDYLSIDLEPPALAVPALERVLESGKRFRCVTYEHDSYRVPDTLVPSRAMLRLHGYRLVDTVEGQDDFWIFDKPSK